MTNSEFVELLIDLAREIELSDPIDWGMINVNEQDAYRLIALGLVDHVSTVPADQQLTTLYATAIKLSVENFVLNLKLLSK